MSETSNFVQKDPNIPILFSGLTATGKSNYSRLIATSFQRPWFDATSQLIKLAQVQSHEQSVWTTDIAMQIQDARRGDAIDKHLDTLIIAKLQKAQSAVVDAWATPWLWKDDAVRIFVNADEETRIKRCLASYPTGAKPTSIEAMKLIAEKDNYTRELFKRLYDFDLFSDHEIFDIHLDTSGFHADTPEKSGHQLAQERILPLAIASIESVIGPRSVQA